MKHALKHIILRGLAAALFAAAVVAAPLYAQEG